MEFRFFETESSWIEATAEEIFSSCRNHNAPVIGLCGGNTPKPLYTYLGQHWPTLQGAKIVLVDERMVSNNHPDSNAGMIKETLFASLPEEKRKYVSFIYPDITENAAETVNTYDETLRALPEFWDVIILGVGPDGHIASLFPNTEALTETTELAIHTETEHFSVRERISVTLPVLLRAKKIILFLSSEKEEVIKELQDGPKTPASFPVKYLLDHPNILVHTLQKPH